MESITLEHVPESHTLHLALFKDVQNAAALHAQLIARNPEFEYALIDASIVRLPHSRRRRPPPSLPCSPLPILVPYPPTLLSPVPRSLHPRLPAALSLRPCTPLPPARVSPHVHHRN